jgi:hypothetical protein
MSDFDYGETLSNGQHEHHPINTEGEYVAPIRRTYIHKCGAATTIGTKIAETYAKNPKYYGRTFCTGCRDYFPVKQFHWDHTMILVGDIEAQPDPEVVIGNEEDEKIHAHVYISEDQLWAHYWNMLESGWKVGSKENLRVVYV